MTTPVHMKCILLAVVCCICLNNLYAQNNNITLQGDNYLNIHNADFPSRITWDQLSDDTYAIGQYPIENYWYVKPNDAHIIVHLATDGGSIFIELSRLKKVFHFPTDYSIQGGGYNDFEAHIKNNDGESRQLDLSRNSSLVVQVEQLDALHLKLSISGKVSIFNQNQLVDIDGKISLQKNSATLPHLQDSYAGCDNTIYNAFSPMEDGGQWRSATQCEESFYQKLFSGIKNSLAPVQATLAARGWIMQGPQYKTLHRINRSQDQNNSYFQMERPYYTISGNANPLKGEYHDYVQRVLAASQSASSASDQAHMEKLQALSKEGEGRYEITMRLVVNMKVEAGGLDFSNAVVKKINENAYVVSGIAGDYHSGAGTYLFIGNWDGEPKWDGQSFSSEPVLPDGGKKLAVQAFYLYLGCNDQLATDLLKHIDTNSLTQLLQVTP